jgi:hypothetical protein
MKTRCARSTCQRPFAVLAAGDSRAAAAAEALVCVPEAAGCGVG